MYEGKRGREGQTHTLTHTHMHTHTHTHTHIHTRTHTNEINILYNILECNTYSHCSVSVMRSLNIGWKLPEVLSWVGNIKSTTNDDKLI